MTDERGGSPAPVRDTRDARDVAHRVARVIRRIIGVPDYEAYVAHVCASHPGLEPLSEREFHRERLSARYSQPGNRCC